MLRDGDSVLLLTTMWCGDDEPFLVSDLSDATVDNDDDDDDDNVSSVVVVPQEGRRSVGSF